MTEIIALIPAAGIGSRMKSECPKQYLNVAGKTIIEHTLSALFEHSRLQQAIVVLNPADTYFHQLAIASDPRITTVIGGDERADSVLAGLNYLAEISPGRAIWVLVHDAARPCLHQDDLDNLLQLADKNSLCGGLLAAPVRDTMKRISASSIKETLSAINQIVDHTVDRSGLWHALTPQLFPLPLLRDCLIKALAEQACVTDESSALEYCGYHPVLVSGRADNIKVTQPEDLALAEFYLSRKQLQTEGATRMRIGHGFDVHKFGGEGPLVIGGVRIPYEQGLIAHSDGDVALHAATDALLGAAALGDIGKLFPDTDPAFKGADSRELLKEAYRRIREKGYRIGNLDITIIAQAPKMLPHIPQMRVNLAEDLGCHMDDINVKATTTEKLGFVGRKEGIACEAVALLVKE
jgi:2-C-methyl-D-erythritol 4-phosphate cytidylyltransferase